MLDQLNDDFVVVVLVNVAVVVTGVVIAFPVLLSIAERLLANGRPTSFIRFSRDTKSSNSMICRTVSDISCMSSEGGENVFTAKLADEPRRY